MSDLLANGSAWLENQRHAHMTRPVVYQRPSDGTEASLDATVGRTTFEQSDESGLIGRFESRDYLVRTQDLVLGGVATIPKTGDRIRETQGAATLVYEVVAGAGGTEPPFRYSDRDRLTLRIHTKHIATET